MTNNQRWAFRISMILLFVFVVWLAVAARAQPAPVLRHGDLLRVYVGSTEPLGARIFVGTTWSVSPNADIGPPFDQSGENPDIMHWSHDVRVIADGDPCLLEPALVIPCRDTGWVDLPIPDVRIEQPPGSDVWVHDSEMRIVIHVANLNVGLCPVVTCGARLVVRRMKLSDVLNVPVSTKRRSVQP